MGEILRLFVPGARITVMVRVPGDPEADFVMTNDQLAEVAEMLARSRSREQLGPTSS